MRNSKIHLLITTMSDIIKETDVIPSASEQELKVKGDDFFYHSFSISFSAIGKFIFDINDQLKNWIPGKGRIDFVSMNASASFDDVGGRLLIAIVPKGVSVNSYGEARTFPNRKLFASNSYNLGTNIDHDFNVPEGMSPMIFPANGPAPPFDILLYNSAKVSGNVDLFIKLRASGPFTYRYTCKWGETAENLKGF